MGVGMNGLEATGTQYKGFIDDLVSQGIISKRAYSVYLDDLGRPHALPSRHSLTVYIASSTGGLILGGYDPSKYRGSLTALPIVSSEDGAPRLAVEWDSISITSAAGTTTQYTSKSRPFPKSGSLDTGFSFTTLPDDILEEFASVFGGTVRSDGSVLFENNPSCTLGQGSVNFGLGGGAVTISVPFSELAIKDSDGYCWLGFQKAGDDTVLSLGDTFLRSAYVVYNYDAMTISVAQARYDSTCTNCIISI